MYEGNYANDVCEHHKIENKAASTVILDFRIDGTEKKLRVAGKYDYNYPSVGRTPVQSAAGLGHVVRRRPAPGSMP